MTIGWEPSLRQTLLWRAQLLEGSAQSADRPMRRYGLAARASHRSFLQSSSVHRLLRPSGCVLDGYIIEVSHNTHPERVRLRH